MKDLIQQGIIQLAISVQQNEQLEELFGSAAYFCANSSTVEADSRIL